ncbi:enoyl-CoA hydratase [Rubellimicrobium arenae]|uniref:enoyl-CoA hydratase n=1 Tax=Rubellimicrobium arenae TaxID=2817372 RepID=UPI001B30A291|nr:enoyl-CoA hydratase [Rubellimicrobium arenae]
MAGQGILGGALAGLLALPASCDLPRDPEGTLDRLAGGTLAVAVVAPELSADERQALSFLADDLGAELSFVAGDIHSAVDALGRGEIQAVAGAIPKDTPLTDETAATNPVGPERFVLLLRQGENALLLAANRAVADAREEDR